MLSFQYGVSLCLIYTLCLTTVLAQDPCAGPANINVAFPELDPPNQIPTGDSRYAQVVLTGNEPFNVAIEADPTAPNDFPIDEYFSHSYNNFGANPGYTLYMIKAIDRDGPTDGQDDDTNILQYTLICRSTSSSDDICNPQTLFKILKVQLIDQNDNSQNFLRVPYSVSVNELTPVGLTIFNQILATDLDEGPNKQVTYSLSNSPGSQCNGTEYFWLPFPAEGFVTVSKPLDYDYLHSLTPGHPYCNLTVTARDEGTPQQSSTTSLIIEILDGDDLGPEFVYQSCIPSTEPRGTACAYPQYRSTITSQSTRPSTLVFTPDPVDPSDPDGHVDIIMQDRDTLNSPIIFRTAFTRPAGYDAYFAVTSSHVSGKQYKGDITYTGYQPIDGATVPQLEIIVEAIENTPNRRTAFASVIVDIVEGSTPTLSITASSSVADVPENAPVLTRISEEKSNAVLKLTLSDSFTPPDGYPPYFDLRVSAGVPFQISHENYTGYVEIIKSLDYEMEQQYIFTVTIISLGPEKEFASIPLTVNVLDVNDNPPIFPSQMSLPNNVINEVPQGDHSTNPHYITSVWASDLDFGPVTYSLDHVDPPVSNGTFRVDPSGVVSLASSVTVGDFYSVYVKASDSGLPSLSSTTIVYVRVTA